MPPNATLLDRARNRPMTVLLLVVFAIAVIAFQLGDTASLKMQAWDESRLAVNAIEMMMTGERVVTTYGFQPDLWNTKPPLVINLMAWSMQLFGPNFFAMRLPSALAACATVFLVVAFTRRVTGSLGCAFAAGRLLITAQSF
ncbi:MAG: ArnT family glycosyltransferase, partial [Janthinobacterium lividum]